MPNQDRERKNQPPTSEGKKQSPRSGAAQKLSKRSEVLQAAGSRQNIGSVEDEDLTRTETTNPKRPKAGR